MTDSHWLVCLCFRLARTVLPRRGGDALGVVSRKDARAEGSSSGGGPMSMSVCGLLLLLLLLLRCVYHVVLAFFVMRVVRLRFAVRACALRGTHEGLRVRVLH
jgi:hypothetical protein